MVVLFSVSENTWIEIFFIKFESNIEKFEAEGRELFNITREFNEKKIEIQVFSHTENNTTKENLENKTLEIREITFLH